MDNNDVTIVNKKLNIKPESNKLNNNMNIRNSLIMCAATKISQNPNYAINNNKFHENSNYNIMEQLKPNIINQSFRQNFPLFNQERYNDYSAYNNINVKTNSNKINTTISINNKQMTNNNIKNTCLNKASDMVQIINKANQNVYKNNPRFQYINEINFKNYVKPNINDDTTKINEKIHNQKSKICKKFIKEFNHSEKDFTEIFDCDSVEEVYLMSSKNIIPNQNYYFILGENSDKNALYFQFFYAFFFSKNLKNDIFSIIEENKSKVESLTYYHSKIMDSIQQFKIELNVLKTKEKLDILNKIKKTPPTEVFSLSRLICICFRILIIIKLSDKYEDEVKSNYKINNIEEFRNSLYDLSKDLSLNADLFKILLEVFDFNQNHIILIDKNDMVKLKETNDNGFKILHFDENNQKKSYYCAIHINNIDESFKEDNPKDIISTNIHKLKSKFNTN